MATPINGFGQPLGLAVTSWTPPARPVRQRMQGAYCTVEPLDPGSHLPDLFEALAGSDADWTYLPHGPFRNLARFRE